MAYPLVRHRRLRSTAALRSLVRETSIGVNDFIAPIFVTEGVGVKSEIASMPGVYHWSLDTMEEELGEIAGLGIQAVLVFGVPDLKDAAGTSAIDDNGIVQRAIRRIKILHPDIVVIADTCLCQFTDHGHCGVVHTSECGADIDNDDSLELLARAAVSQARAGADIIAPPI